MSQEPTITVTITGRTGAGKSCLANKLALSLQAEGHEIRLNDSSEDVAPVSRIASRFINPRKINIRVLEGQ
jgi:adenylylsulfate kinase-like enzyme